MGENPGNILITIMASELTSGAEYIFTPGSSVLGKLCPQRSRYLATWRAFVTPLHDFEDIIICSHYQCKMFMVDKVLLPLPARHSSAAWMSASSNAREINVFSAHLVTYILNADPRFCHEYTNSSVRKIKGCKVFSSELSLIRGRLEVGKGVDWFFLTSGAIDIRHARHFTPEIISKRSALLEKIGQQKPVRIILSQGYSMALRAALDPSLANGWRVTIAPVTWCTWPALSCQLWNFSLSS